MLKLLSEDLRIEIYSAHKNKIFTAAEDLPLMIRGVDNAVTTGT